MEVHLCLFLLNPKYFQNEIWSNTTALYDKHFNMFLAQCWRMETSSNYFYDFIKMIINQDLATFNSQHLSFLNVPCLPFQKT